jgi:hypothetical protein
MSMIPSPTINREGEWRWFVTFASPDTYESRLFEIITEFDDENNPQTWEERHE